MLSSEGMKDFRTFQSKVDAVVKDSINPHFKNSYASLQVVIDTALPELSKNKLTFNSWTTIVNDEVCLVSRLTHEDESFIESVYPLRPSQENNPQQMGSAITYARRYVMLLMLGLAPEDDDDGSEASGLGKTTSKPKARSGGRATEAQLGFVKKLIADKKGLTKASDQEKYIADEFQDDGITLKEMTSAQASVVIDRLKSMRADSGSKSEPPF